MKQECQGKKKLEKAHDRPFQITISNSGSDWSIRTLIEKGSEAAFESMKKEYNTYLGGIFEKVAKEFLWKTHALAFTKLGKWWHKNEEIDIVALNDNFKEIFFFECKWRDLKEGTARKILEELREKSSWVDWNNDNRKVHFGIIARHIEIKIC